MTTNLTAENALNIAKISLERKAYEQVTNAKIRIKDAAEQCFTSLMFKEKHLGKRARQLLENEKYQLVYHHQYGNDILYKVIWSDKDSEINTPQEDDILIDYKR